MNLRRLTEIYENNFLYTEAPSSTGAPGGSLTSAVSGMIPPEMAESLRLNEPLTPEEEATMYDKLSLRMATSQRKIYLQDPYLAVILSRLVFNIVAPEDPRCRTMAVDSVGNIYINPKFAIRISEDEFTAVFAHEAMHIVNGTFERQKDRDMRLWNLVTDASMNWGLERDGYTLPIVGIRPDLATGEMDLEPFGVPVKIRVLSEDKSKILSCEEIYSQLDNWIEEESKKPKKNIYILKAGKCADGKCEPGGKGGKPSGGGSGGGGTPIEVGKPGEGSGEGPIIIVPKGTPGAEPLPDDISPEEIRKAIEEALGEIEEKTSLDKHLNDDEAKELNPDLQGKDLGEIRKINEERRQKDIEKGKELEKERKERDPSLTYGGKGTGPGAIRQIVMGSLPKSLPNWRSIISKYLQAGKSSERTYSRLRANPLALGYPSPSTYKDPNKLAAIFAIDTSGSVGDKELGIAMTYAEQCAKVAKHLDVRIILWHHQPYWCSEPLTSPGAMAAVRAKINKSVEQGGNGMEEIGKLVVQKKLNPTVIIYITDGQEGHAPDFNKYIKTPYNKLFIIVSAFLQQTMPEIIAQFSPPPKGGNPTARPSEIVFTPELK